MGAVPAELSKFVAFLSQDQQHKPQQNFLADVLPALFVSGSLMLSKIAEAFGPPPPGVPREREYDTREHRLSRNFSNNRLDLGKLLDRYYETIAPLTTRDDGEGVTVAYDGTDYRKEHARPHRLRGMQGATWVRDASRSTREVTNLATGYPGITVEATLADGNQVPLAHRLFSRKAEDPLAGRTFLSDAQADEDMLTRLTPHVGAKAWWTFDQGYAGMVHLDMFDRHRLRWIVKFPSRGEHGKRHMRVQGGITVKVKDYAPLVPLPYTREWGRGRKKKAIRMGLVKVWLRGEDGRWQDRPRTLLVGYINDAAGLPRVGRRDEAHAPHPAAPRDEVEGQLLNVAEGRPRLRRRQEGRVREVPLEDHRESLLLAVQLPEPFRAGTLLPPEVCELEPEDGDSGIFADCFRLSQEGVVVHAAPPCRGGYARMPGKIGQLRGRRNSVQCPGLHVLAVEPAPG
jgi:hypothetical protein